MDLSTLLQDTPLLQIDGPELRSCSAIEAAGYKKGLRDFSRSPHAVGYLFMFPFIMGMAPADSGTRPDTVRPE